MKPASLHRRILFPLLLCGGLLFALLFWYFSPFFSPGENRRFSAYVEERFHSEVTSSAITLHYTLADPASRGIAPGTASFGTVSIPDRTSYDALLQSVETTLTSFHRNRLSAENQITLDLLLYELDCEKMPGSTSLLAEPLGPSLGIQAQLPILLAEYPFRTQQDIADYLHLLQDLPRYFSDLIALEQEKSRQGVFQNDLAVDGIIRQCSAFLADADTPEIHLLHTVFQINCRRLHCFLRRKGISVCRRMKNSLPPVFFPPTALFPMRFLHSAAKEHRTPVVFPGRKADFPTMRIFSAAASVLTLHRRS